MSWSVNGSAHQTTLDGKFSNTSTSGEVPFSSAHTKIFSLPADLYCARLYVPSGLCTGESSVFWVAFAFCIGIINARHPRGQEADLCEGPPLFSSCRGCSCRGASGKAPGVVPRFGPTPWVQRGLKLPNLLNQLKPTLDLIGLRERRPGESHQLQRSDLNGRKVTVMFSHHQTSTSLFF